MGRLQARMVARLQGTVNEYLSETCTLTRIDFVQGRLGMTESEVIVASGVACRVIDDSQRQGQGYQNVGLHEAQVDAYRVILPSGTTIDSEYRITVGLRVYEVVALLDDRSNELFVGCRVRRIRGND